MKRFQRLNAWLSSGMSTTGATAVDAGSTTFLRCPRPHFGAGSGVVAIHSTSWDVDRRAIGIKRF